MEWVQLLPLVAGALWILTALIQIARGRFHTLPERYLIAFTVFVGLYAIGDGVFLNATVAETATAALIVSLEFATVTAPAFMLYGIGPHVNPRRAILAAVPLAALLGALVPLEVVAGIRAIPTGDVAFLPDFDPVWTAVWAAGIWGFCLAGLVGIYSTYRLIRAHSRALGRRILASFGIFSLSLVLGILTYAYYQFTGETVPSPLSSTFMVPAILLIVVLLPGGLARIRGPLGIGAEETHAVRAAFLTYANGSLIASQARPDAQADPDLLLESLDVIQNFMRLSFPVLGGTWLRSVRYGDDTLLMERGRYVSLVLLVEGAEDERVRKVMRTRLAAFEAKNAARLTSWAEASGAAVDTDELLGGFFAAR